MMMVYAYSNGRKYRFKSGTNGEMVDIVEEPGISVVLESDGSITELSVRSDAPRPIVHGVSQYAISIYPLSDGWYADIYDVPSGNVLIREPWVSYSENNYREANIVYAETFPEFSAKIQTREVKLSKIKDK